METGEIKEPDLSISIADLKLKNPVMAASGTFGFGFEYRDFFDPQILGAVILKGLTLKPLSGNLTPRTVETPAGMLNAIGLQNPGIDCFVKKYYPCIKELDTRIIANISGSTVDEYARIAQKINELTGIDALEVNISCPNVDKGGLSFGQEPDSAFEVVCAVKKVTDKPVIVKLAPNVTSIVEIAESVTEAGADVLSCINTLLGMVIDIDKQKPFLANKVGGLSGPAIKPVAVRSVYEIVEKIDLPVIGCGGIMDSEDALEFILGGAEAVAVGTANFVDPMTMPRIIKGLKNYLKTNELESLGEIVGAAQQQI